MTGVIAISPKRQFTDGAGNPAVGYKLYTYAAGTLTPLTTWKDEALSSSNTNPIILDARGECDLWLSNSLEYKLVLKTDANVPVWSVDSVYGSIKQATITADIAAAKDSITKISGVTPTAAGLALLDDADAAAQRTTLGLGTAALSNAGDFQPADADIPTVSASQVEMETGTEPALRSMSPLRVKQAIAAIAPPKNAAARAWVNFNGTLAGPITPRGSYNVSSVTKNATGDYTINFTTALANSNYAVSHSAVLTGAADNNFQSAIHKSAGAFSSSSVRVVCRQSNVFSTLIDCDYVTVTVHGD